MIFCTLTGFTLHIDTGFFGFGEEAGEEEMTQSNFMSGLSKFHEVQERLHLGLNVVHKTDKSGEYNLDEESLKYQCVITDPAVRSLLKLLCTPQKGRNKDWCVSRSSVMRASKM